MAPLDPETITREEADRAILDTKRDMILDKIVSDLERLEARMTRAEERPPTPDVFDALYKKVEIHDTKLDSLMRMEVKVTLCLAAAASTLVILGSAAARYITTALTNGS